MYILQVRDFVRRRRWLRRRIRKPQAANQPAASRKTEAHTDLVGPGLSRTSLASSAGTGPILSHPSHILSGSTKSANGSFTSQPGASQRSLATEGAVGNRGGSFTSLSGTSPGQGAAQEDRPWSSHTDTQQALSAQCNKWGSSVANELHKASSSVDGGNASVARDSVHSDDYVGNSPMSAGLNRLSGTSQAFQPSGFSTTSHFSSDSLPPVAVPSSSQGHFVRESTPQTMGTAGGIPVAPQLAQATGHADIQSMLSHTTTFGGDAVRHPQSEDFPSAEELAPERSNPSAPAMVGQIRHGRLSDDSVAAFPASAVAASLTRPADSQSVMQTIDQRSAQSPVSAGHHHSYEKPGVVLAKPVESSGSIS